MAQNRKFNILMVSWRGPGHPHAGGAEIVTHEYAKGWVKAGHKVTLFTSIFENAKHNETIDGVEIIRSGSQVLEVHLKFLLWYLRENNQKYDLIIDHFHGIPFFTPLFTKTKKIGFIHEVTKDVWLLNPLPKPLNFVPAIFGKAFEPFIFKLYKNIHFLTVSNSTKIELIDWGIPKKNITVIQNGVIVPKFKKAGKNKIPTITFIGALAKDKGIEDAITAFSHIKNNKTCKFWIIGRSDERYLQVLKKMASDLGLKKDVKFWGYVPENKKFELLAKSHLVINPSQREGWGLTVIEAAAVGTPTVGYNVVGLKDSIIHGKTGYLTKKDPSEMARIVISLLEDKTSYQKISQQAKRWSKNFSWRISIKKSLTFINDIVDS
jgi:glycosyltransferase involved in cell wall biosynthesis